MSSYEEAYALYQAGHAQKAADRFRILCATDPFKAPHWFGLGASLQENGDYREALYAWAMTAVMDHADPFPHFHAAQCLISLGEIDEAGKALKEAEERIHEMTHPLRGPITLLKERNR